MGLLQRKVFSFVAVERSRLTIALWQGVVKSLVVAYLFLGQLSAGLQQGGMPWQGASSALGAPGGTKLCRPCPQHHRLLLVSLPAPYHDSREEQRMVVFSVCRCWADVRSSEQLWLHSEPPHAEAALACTLQHNADQEMGVSQECSKIPSKQAVRDEGFTIFCYKGKKGYYIDLAIRAVLKIRSTVPVAVEDAYHTGRQDSPGRELNVQVWKMN